ncbi:hypothetical protein [Adhaeribacter aquaticus]|uniref:hypothetical protein n=1 Tax=Adhaeribacter aquaticus TaxID=299567 RepID=UPI000422957E|nr:hypothetical protein [Adhaeribacter aquaticus]
MIVLTVCLISIGQTLAFVPADDLIKEANQLFNQFKDREALSKYQQVLNAEPQNYEALWKMSLLQLRIGSRYSDETEKLDFFAAARDYAERAVAISPEGADAHYTLALALNNLSMVMGVKERVSNLKLIKFHIDKTIALKFEHASAWQLLGRWYYKAANLTFLECTFSKLITGGLPEGATNELAIEALRQAITLNPGNINGYLDLALIYRDVKNKSAAIAVLQEAIKLDLVTAEDLEINRRCKSLLHDLGGVAFPKVTNAK